MHGIYFCITTQKIVYEQLLYYLRPPVTTKNSFLDIFKLNGRGVIHNWPISDVRQNIQDSITHTHTLIDLVVQESFS